MQHNSTNDDDPNHDLNQLLMSTYCDASSHKQKVVILLTQDAVSSYRSIYSHSHMLLADDLINDSLRHASLSK